MANQAVKKLELTESQCKILEVMLKEQLAHDLDKLLTATEEQDRDAMYVLLIISNEERKILEMIAS